MRLGSFALLCAVVASGCAGARWSVADSTPILAVTMAPAELHGPVDRALVAQRRTAMIGELRAHGYQVLENSAPGVPLLAMTIEGTMIDDSQLHAPDDPRHHIYNDLHYRFVGYNVHIDVIDSGGHVIVCGRASADRDPAGAMSELVAHLLHDVPPAVATFAAR
jgi:hypothetical protein